MTAQTQEDLLAAHLQQEKIHVILYPFNISSLILLLIFKWYRCSFKIFASVQFF